jgi:hypothetical protein
MVLSSSEKKEIISKLFKGCSIGISTDVSTQIIDCYKNKTKYFDALAETLLSDMRSYIQTPERKTINADVTKWDKRADFLQFSLYTFFRKDVKNCTDIMTDITNRRAKGPAATSYEFVLRSMTESEEACGFLKEVIEETIPPRLIEENFQKKELAQTGLFEHFYLLFAAFQRAIEFPLQSKASELRNDYEDLLDSLKTALPPDAETSDKLTNTWYKASLLLKQIYAFPKIDEVAANFAKETDESYKIKVQAIVALLLIAGSLEEISIALYHFMMGSG